MKTVAISLVGVVILAYIAGMFTTRYGLKAMNEALKSRSEAKG